MPTLPLPVAPSLASDNDEQLVRRVRNFLHGNQVRGPLNVEARHGTVVLRGRVGSFYHRQLLVHGAQRVAGVRRVIDELDVAPWHAK